MRHAAQRKKYDEIKKIKNQIRSDSERTVHLRYVHVEVAFASDGLVAQRAVPVAPLGALDPLFAHARHHKVF